MKKFNKFILSAFLEPFRVLPSLLIEAFISAFPKSNRANLKYLDEAIQELKAKRQSGEITEEDIESFYSTYKKIDLHDEDSIVADNWARVPKSNKVEENNGFKIKDHNLVHLFSIIPKSSREEAITDLQDVMSDMKDQGCRKFYIGLIVILHLASVLYHAFFFKLKDYFYPATQQQSSND